MRKTLSMVAAYLCAAACIYPYTPDIEETPADIVAVDGDICIGDLSTVRLGPLLSLWPNQERWWGTGFQDASVWLEDDAGQKYIGVPSAPQVSTYYDLSSDLAYSNGTTFRIDTKNAPADRSYRLCIEALGESFVSDWSGTIEPPKIEGIDFVADDENVTVAVSVDGGEDGTGYLLLSFDEAWEFHADYFPNYSFNPETMEITPDMPVGYNEYWCYKRSDTGRSVPVDYTGMTTTAIKNYPLQTFPRTDSRNHRLYCINVKAKTLSPASYRFLKTLEDNTDGGDNLFTPNPGEIAGNLRCESNPERTVLGYVIVSRTTTQRAFLDSRYLKTKRPDTSSLLYLLTKDYMYYYSNDYRPLVENTMSNSDPEQYGPYGWGPRYCYDCTAAGGTKTRPDYWDE